MPKAPPRICSTCGQSGCPGHARSAWPHARPVARIRGRQLQRLRQRLFDATPLCAQCLLAGRTTIATIRDHIVPLAEGGLDLEANTQPLCQACSDIKTAREAQRGVHRARSR